MITFHNPHHALHQGKLEMFRGQLVPCFEVPDRVDHVLAELQRRPLGPVLPPQAFDDRALTGIHSARYLDFLKTAWDEWVALDAANAARDALPSVWPVRTLRSDVLPANFFRTHGAVFDGCRHTVDLRHLGCGACRGRLRPERRPGGG